MTRDELLDWLHVHLAAGVGPKRFRLLMDCFGSAGRVTRASLSELKGVPKLGPSVAAQIYEGLQTVDPQEELSLAEEAGVNIVTPVDDVYPKLLASCADPPALLYVKGQLRQQDELSVAVVGTRRPCHYGSEQAFRFGHLLTQAGIVVVSGLARGVDAQAHRGALMAKGRTLAVLGCGLGQIYPPEHDKLAEEILRLNGAIISEYPMRTEPASGNFPARNRIVAGMTLGTLVVEAPTQSGALITADLAIEYNREVFAIPGPVDMPNFQGCHKFIKSGKAKLVTCLEDILDELGMVGNFLNKETKSDSKINASETATLPELLQAVLTEHEKAILDFLVHGPNDTDTICQCCQLSPAQVSSSLTTLQLKGLIKTLPGNQFTIRR